MNPARLQAVGGGAGAGGTAGRQNPLLTANELCDIFDSTSIRAPIGVAGGAGHASIRASSGVIGGRGKMTAVVEDDEDADDERSSLGAR